MINPHIWDLPSDFNFPPGNPHASLVGNVFIQYYTPNYDGHQRMRAAIQGDKVDFVCMQSLEALRRQGIRPANRVLAPRYVEYDA